MNRCLHFVGFRDSAQFDRAVRLFGSPDFVHRTWDDRAFMGGERGEDDVFVFASGTFDDVPSPFSFNDSDHQ